MGERILGLGGHLRGASREPHGAEIDGLDPVGIAPRVADGDLGRCAPDVTNGDAFRQGNARGEDRATVGERALLLLREHARLDAGRPRERSDEHGGVGRLAPGSGEEDVERGDALAPGRARHAADRLCRGRHMNGRDGAVPLDLLAQREP